MRLAPPLIPGFPTCSRFTFQSRISGTKFVHQFRTAWSVMRFFAQSSHHTANKPVKLWHVQRVATEKRLMNLPYKSTRYYYYGKQTSSTIVTQSGFLEGITFCYHRGSYLGLNPISSPLTGMSGNARYKREEASAIQSALFMLGKFRFPVFQTLLVASFGAYVAALPRANIKCT